MFSFSLMARCAACAVVLGAGACARPDGPVSTPVARTWESREPPPEARAEPPPAPTSHPAENASENPVSPVEVIAVVNGAPIAQRELVQMLMESHGLGLLEQLVLLTAARQRGADMSLTVTKADISAAHEDALRRLSTPVVDTDGQVLDREEAQRLLEEFLEAKNISRCEWNCRMEQRAYLRRIAEAEVADMKVTEADLRNEYDLAYGERVQVRHIQVSSLATAARVRALLAAKKDFELLARQMSENQFTAASGGLARPFTRDDPGVTPLLRKVAFELEVGEVSETIRDGEAYHIIRCERRFPASDVGFENVNGDELRRRLLERLIRQRQQDLETELFQQAAVHIRDAELSRQFHEKHRRSNG